MGKKQMRHALRRTNRAIASSASSAPVSAASSSSRKRQRAASDDDSDTDTAAAAAAAAAAAMKQKRTSSSIRCILLDIEGTTTPITFVTDVLFPYARDNVRQHLTTHWDTKETKDDVSALLTEAYMSPADTKEATIDALVQLVHKQIEENRKTTPLKQLQGHMWRAGYESGELKGTMYNDVAPCLESWTRRGYEVAIYSSGSVEAQQLIFTYSTAGDLTPFLSGYYDTTSGQKVDAQSYTTIAKALNYAPQSILFITDRYTEAEAADKAGCKVLLSVREGNAELPANNAFATIHSFVDARL